MTPEEQPAMRIRAGAHELRFGDRTLIMGIVNVTPDSFSGDGIRGVDEAIRRAEKLVEDGADIVDVGGESTRPGATPVPEAEEALRVVPVIHELARRLSVPISVDTRKASVARGGLAAGASIVNDVCGLKADPAMAGVVARHQPVGLVIAHNHTGTKYRDLMSDIRQGLAESIGLAVQAGMDPSQIIVDPGFGFGKTPAQNLEIIRSLGNLKSLQRPILIGVSNKASLGVLTGGADVKDRLEATIAANVLAIAHGADVVRVHDVRAMARARAIADPVVRGISDDARVLRSPGLTL